MEIKTRKKKGVLTLSLSGEVNIYSVREIKDAFMDALSRSDEVSVDLSGVSEIDSSGVQVLFLARREAGASGKVLRIASRSDATAAILGLYRIRELGDGGAVAEKG